MRSDGSFGGRHNLQFRQQEVVDGTIRSHLLPYGLDMVQFGCRGHCVFKQMPGLSDVDGIGDCRQRGRDGRSGSGCSVNPWALLDYSRSVSEAVLSMGCVGFVGVGLP